MTHMLVPFFVCPALSSFYLPISRCRSPVAIQYSTPLLSLSPNPPPARSAIPSSSDSPALLNRVAQVPDRGIFGLEDDEREELDGLIRSVETSKGGCPGLVEDMQPVDGVWRVIYTNLEILGWRRIRLGIGGTAKAGLVTLVEMWQVVDVGTRTAKNIVEFEMMGGMRGWFETRAEYEIEGELPSAEAVVRVNVTLRNWSLKPAKAETLLGENKGILLEIFNPQGWLDVTYVDDSLRVGRDDKGHVFVLERYQGAPVAVLGEA